MRLIKLVDVDIVPQTNSHFVHDNHVYLSYFHTSLCISCIHKILALLWFTYNIFGMPCWLIHYSYCDHSCDSDLAGWFTGLVIFILWVSIRIWRCDVCLMRNYSTRRVAWPLGTCFLWVYGPFGSPISHESLIKKHVYTEYITRSLYFITPYSLLFDGPDFFTCICNSDSSFFNYVIEY